MTDRHIDILETDFGISPVSQYVISRAKESAGEEFSVVLPAIDGLYGPGTAITIKGIDGFVTQRQFQVGQRGYISTISGVATVADLIRKAPPKTLMYMSMTPTEHEEFKVANSDQAGKVDYSFLEYIPLIRECDPKLYTGAWDLRSVVRDLADRLGMPVVCNVRNYWLRQVQADVQSSFFDTIVSLVSFVRPIVYVDDGTIYLLNKPFRNGTADFSRISQFSQTETYNFNSKVSYVKLSGGIGKWDRSKHKGGPVDAEKETTITNTVQSASQSQLAVLLHGDIKTVMKWLGSTEYGTDATLEVPSDAPVADETTTTEVYRLDPFGNNKALLGRQIVTMNNVLGTPAVKTYEAIETYTYEFLDEQYERPRMTRKESIVGQYTWQLTQLGGQASRRYYKADVDKIIETYVYAPNGNLLVETYSRESDCFKVGDMLIEVTLGDYYWVAEGSEPPEGLYVKATVEERIVRYRQINRDLYQKMTYRRTLGGVRRAAGDGIFSTNVEQLQGRVPKHPRLYRKMQIYAEDLPVSQTAPMDAPAVIVSNPNVVDWDDAAGLLSEVRRNHVDFDYSIERRLTIPGDIPIDIGWNAEFGDVAIVSSGLIPSVTVQDGMVASWQKVKDARGVTVQTVVTLEGKVRS